MTAKQMHYCPGCGHGIIHRLVAEVIDELGIQDKTVGACPVGCAVVANEYFAVDMQQAAHGRAPAVATGVKRCRPDLVVFTYQGDGDLASIGMTEVVHAAARGEKITTIFVNNAIYGMTGGQMAPTSLLGQVTTTSPFGRKKEIQGSPIRVAEMLATLEGAAYIARASVHNAANVMKTKRMIRRAFDTQLAGDGYSLVEVLSTCPTNWGLSAVEAADWLAKNMIPYYPLGEIKTPKSSA